MANKKTTNKVKSAAKKQATKYARKHKKGVAIFIGVVIALLIAAIVLVYILKPQAIRDLFDGIINIEQTEDTTNTPSNGGTTNGGLTDGTTDGTTNGGTTDDNTVDDSTSNGGTSDDNTSNGGTSDGSTDGSTSGGEITGGTTDDIKSADLSIHFIKFATDNAGDSVLIKVGDTEVLIDAGPSQSGATNIKNYLKDYCTDGVLEYVIVTHSDQDHIAGMVGTSSKGTYNGILYSYNVGTIIRFANTNKTSTSSSTLYGKFLNAVDNAVANGANAYTALQCYNNTDGAQSTYYLDEEHTISMNILYNYYYDHTSSDENNYSVCMLLTQQLADGNSNNYLFTGDLEVEGEEYLVQYNQLPEVELYKAGHHGSKTSSNDVLLSVIKPKYVAVCCCAGTNEYTNVNANQFPTQAFIDRVSKYTDAVYVTNVVSDNEAGFEAMNGDIVFYYGTTATDDTYALRLYCSNNYTKLKDTDWFKANRTGWES
jgi:beta-lactamase superfamily II metal-dependent hydrolase